MKIVQNVPGPSQDSFNSLSDQIAINTISSGAASTTVPANAKECICYAYKSGTTNYIPINIDLNNGGYYRGGQYLGNGIGFGASVLYNSSTRAVSIAQFFENGTDVTSSALIKVYAKG